MDYFNMEKFENCDQPIEIINALKEIEKTLTGFIVFSGKNGTGKSYAAKCVYNSLNPYKSPDHDHDIAILTTQAELNMTYNKKLSEYGQVFTYLDYIRKTKLFVLDDLGTRTPTDAFMDFIYSLVDYRYENKLATIITTNLNANDMRKNFSDAFVSRVASGKCFRFEGKDRRSNPF